jgi:ABC-type dipeptide/oligopeptide/nickel transport system ATPase component
MSMKFITHDQTIVKSMVRSVGLMYAEGCGRNRGGGFLQ